MGTQDDFRTHGSGSAIDDDMPPSLIAPAANMTADADQAQGIPGSSAIPADMPNAPRGDATLEYNLQNFNALVAANTAMETAIADAALREEALRDENAHLREIIEESLKPAIAALTKSTDDQKRIIQSMEKKVYEAGVELGFAMDQRTVLQRRNDRLVGYLDALVDRDARVDPSETMRVPVPAPAIGPSFDDIPMPVRRSTRTDGDNSAYLGIGEPLRFRGVGGEGGRRRYHD